MYHKYFSVHNVNAANVSLVAVSPEDSVTVYPIDFVSLLNSNIALLCVVGGDSNNYQWEKNGRIVGNDSMLNVLNIDASSGGDYTCRVSNNAGNGSASTTLYVAPYIVTPLEEVTLTSNGSNINLTCETQGFPAPNIIWDRNKTDGIVANVTDEIVANVTDEIVATGPQLSIPSVVLGQEGAYRCLARATINGLDFEESDFTILIGM